ncbi:hypothetical protein BXY66_2511 [Shimia isoporae]|uniref:Uncharacterized protein n=1 Tax=Shimia isoporae TaxID=647720 RepID=A0A4R1N555_9RHOB|nr:hypothetical protein BXY66_2511 [Shimia isoporae]
MATVHPLPKLNALPRSGGASSFLSDGLLYRAHLGAYCVASLEAKTLPSRCHGGLLAHYISAEYYAAYKDGEVAQGDWSPGTVVVGLGAVEDSFGAGDLLGLQVHRFVDALGQVGQIA